MSVLYGGSRLSPLTSTQIIAQPDPAANQIFFGAVTAAESTEQYPLGQDPFIYQLWASHYAAQAERSKSQQKQAEQERVRKEVRRARELLRRRKKDRDDLQRELDRLTALEREITALREAAELNELRHLIALELQERDEEETVLLLL